MTTAQVVETSVTVNNNSLIHDYVHPDNKTQPTFDYNLIVSLCSPLMGTNKHNLHFFKIKY